jgi:hypothetical protein
MKVLFWTFHVALAVLSVHPLSASTFDWHGFERAVAAYQARPNAITADAIRVTLPSKHVSYDHSPAERSALRALDELLPALFISIHNRDRVATGLGLDFLLVADGGMLEDIFSALSELIILDPALFLDELNTRRHVPPDLLTFMGHRFVDKDSTVRCNELRERHSSLSGITDPGLADVRARCLGLLTQEIAESCPATR